MSRKWFYETNVQVIKLFKLQNIHIFGKAKSWLIYVADVLKLPIDSDFNHIDNKFFHQIWGDHSDVLDNQDQDLKILHVSQCGSLLSLPTVIKGNQGLLAPNSVE